MADAWDAFRAAADARCAGRSWVAYGLLWLLIVGFAVPALWDAEAWTPVTWLTIAIHETGHFVTMWWAPEALSVAAGTLFQWGAPLACGWLLWRQGEPFPWPGALAWLGMSLNLSVPYIADASTQALPLLRVGAYQPTIHDWHYLLGSVGLLGAEGAIAALCRGVAIVVLLVGLALGAWIVRRMQALARGGG